MIDPFTVLERLKVPSEGWRKALVEWANGEPGLGFEGLVDPSGDAWEAQAFTWVSFPRGKALKELAQRVLADAACGYQQRVVQVDGLWYLAERYRDNIRPHAGLVPLGDWVNGSCGGCPDQHSCGATFRGEPVTLYLRWRWDDPWTGFVIRWSAEDPVGGIRAPWSPNLLPVDPPDTAEPSFLEMLQNARVADPWVTRGEEDRAKTELVRRADMWLRVNCNKPEAWT